MDGQIGDKRDEHYLEKAEGSTGDSATAGDLLADAYTTGQHPDPKHPLNLPRWRKWAALVVLSWSGFVANYSAAGQLTAFPEIAASLDSTIPAVANTVGYALLGLAVGPLFFNPMSMTIGRKPTLLLSTILFMPCAGWLSAATSYSSFSAARFFSGFASAASQTVPPMIIADMFKKSERGDKLSFYGIAVVIAPGIAPVVCSYATVNQGWRWIYYYVIILIALQLILFLLFLPETQYIPDPAKPVTGRIGVKYLPWQRPAEYLRLAARPLVLSRMVALTAPAFYYGFVFGISVGLTVIAPQLLRGIYHFSTEAQGLSYLTVAIGAILGKTAGGWVGDRVVLWKQKRTGERHPEYRIFAMIPILPLLLVGTLVFGLTVELGKHWIAPLIGIAIYYAGVSASTGLLQTYMLESYLVEPMNAMAIFQFWKCVWGFVVPFFVIEWGESSSWREEYIIQAVLVFGLGILVCGTLLRYGHGIRRKQGMPSTDNM